MRYLSVIIILICGLSVFGQTAGSVDTTFKASAYAPYLTSLNRETTTNGIILTTVAQSDGKILVGGEFSVASGVPRSGITRLNADGSLDTEFNPPDLFARGGNSAAQVYAIAIQSDGSIIVGGIFGVTGSERTNLIRLNADGTVDNTFNNPSTNSYGIARISIDSDDSILTVAGCQLIRYDQNGLSMRVLSLTNQCFSALTSQPDGKILTNLGRYNSDTTIDSSFHFPAVNGTIRKIISLPDGKVLLAGGFSTVNGFAQNGIARLNADGSLDSSFNSNAVGANGSVTDAILGADNKILIFGNFTSYNGVGRKFIAKLNADGTLDTSFTSPFPASSTAGIKLANILSSGKIIVVDSVDDLLRLNGDGSIDSAFNAAKLQFAGSVSEIVQQSDGKIIAGGTFTMANGEPRDSLVRYNLDGSLDESFKRPDYFPGLKFNFRKIMLQADDKLIVSAYNLLLRLNPDGSRDTSFNSTAYVEDFAVLPDGKFIINGRTRLLSDGSIDNSFNSPIVSGVTTTIVQPDGKILIGGIFGQVNNVSRNGIARLNADGTLDFTFNPPYGIQGGALNQVILQPDGKILLSGGFTSVNGVPRSSKARLNSDGSLDADFNPIFEGTTYNFGAVQSDGKILIVLTSYFNGIISRKIARLNSDGTIDASFMMGDANGNINKIAIESDGKILLGGSFTRINGLSAVGIARLTGQTIKSRKRVKFT